MLAVLGVLLVGAALLVLGNLIQYRAASAGSRTGVLLAPAAIERPARTRTRQAPNISLLVFGGAALLYGLVGAYLVFVEHVIVGDAAARVAQAWYVIGSRDPHLAAIGFVWNPLPSVAAIPLVAGRG